MRRPATISDSLQDLIGKPAWGLKGTHGSMFFLEIGSPAYQRTNSRGEIIRHGEWHFLFEWVRWSFSNEATKLLDSDDETSTIDTLFETLELGSVSAARFDETSGKLKLQFSRGTEVNVEPNDIDPADSDWALFIPGELAWSWSPDALTLDSIHATRT